MVARKPTRFPGDVDIGVSLTVNGINVEGMGNQTNVSEASQLTGVLSSDVVYVIDGVIDMAGQSITVPQGGLTIHGLDYNISGLIDSTASHTMFIDDGVYAGPLAMRNMYITVSGAGSQVFDLDNAENGGAVELEDFNFVSCVSLGILDNYRQGLAVDFGVIGCVDGMTLEGNWAGGFAIITAIIVSAGVNFTGTLLKKGSALVVGGSIRSDINALQLHSSGAVCDFEPANITNDSEFLMTGVRVNPSSTAFPNMPASSVKALFDDCVGTPNTYPGGVIEITTGATTTIASDNVLVQMAGTGTASSLTWMEAVGNNGLKSISSETYSVEVSGSYSFTGGNNDVMAVQIRHYDDSASTYFDIGPLYVATLNGGPAGVRAENLTFGGYAELDENDRVEVWVMNQTDLTNIDTIAGGQMRVKRR